MRKITTLIALLATFAVAINAQTTTIRPGDSEKFANAKHNGLELGLMGGAMVYTGDAHCEKFLLKNGLNLDGGVYLRNYWNDKLSTRLNFLVGQIRGKDSDYPSQAHGDRGFEFTTPIYDLSATMEFEPWGHKRYSSGTFRRILSPYINAGIGLVSAKPNTFYNETRNPNLTQQIGEDKANDKTMHLTIPFGAGIRYDLNKRLTLGAEGSFRLPFTDYLDGISKSANPDANDWYQTANLILGYRFNYKRDADKDGIADEDDACPLEPGNIRGKGCPDQDGDGVVDKLDNCPVEVGSAALNGCPDRDSDGIADRDDACPDYAGDAANGGCPDKDGDGIVDMKDDCPDVKGSSFFNGCPDTDGDGITDKLDACPTERGLKEDKGCPKPEPKPEPIPVPVASTSTTTSNSSSTSSSSSTSGGSSSSTFTVASDAVVTGQYVDYSSVQNLPNGATYSGNGVEVDPSRLVTSTVRVEGDSYTTTGAITSEETAVFDEALYGIQFETGSAVIANSSFGILNKVYSIMNRRGDFSFEIAGHTDNTGNSEANLRLSESRAKAVYNFLVKKGIGSSRLTYRGYGDTNPVADNGTAAGRTKNRRVQFVVR